MPKSNVLQREFTVCAYTNIQLSVKLGLHTQVYRGAYAALLFMVWKFSSL